MARVNTRVNLNRKNIQSLKNLPTVTAYLEIKAKELNALALASFLAQVKHTHPVSPPPYAKSFKTRRVMVGIVRCVQAYNDDPIAGLVEFGAHIGANPDRPVPALRYRPYGNALNILAVF